MNELNYFTPSDLVAKLQDASLNGNIQFIEKFLTSDWVIFETNLAKFDKVLSRVMSNASTHGYLDIVRILLDSPFKKNLNSPHNIQIYLTNAARYNHIEIVKYLIDTPSVNIGSNFTTPYWGAINAAEYGNLDIIKYLLEPSKNYLYNSSKPERKILEAACRKNNVPILQYLITLPNFNSSDYLESSFKIALENNQIENLKYFIFDLNIEKSKYISSLIKKEFSASLEVGKMFESRELNHTLNSELSLSTNKNKNIKI